MPVSVEVAVPGPSGPSLSRRMDGCPVSAGIAIFRRLLSWLDPFPVNDIARSRAMLGEGKAQVVDLLTFVYFIVIFYRTKECLGKSNNIKRVLAGGELR